MGEGWWGTVGEGWWGTVGEGWWETVGEGWWETVGEGRWETVGVSMFVAQSIDYNKCPSYSDIPDPLDRLTTIAFGNFGYI